MAQVLNQILDQLKMLELEELQQLNQVIQEYLADRQAVTRQSAFHQALLTSGLVRQIKHPLHSQPTERQPVQVRGKPVSETIVDERR